MLLVSSRAKNVFCLHLLLMVTWKILENPAKFFSPDKLRNSAGRESRIHGFLLDTVCCLSTRSFGTFLHRLHSMSQYQLLLSSLWMTDQGTENKLKNPSVKWENINKTTYLPQNQKPTPKHFSDCGLSSHPGNVIYAHMPRKDHLPAWFCAGEMGRQPRPAGLHILYRNPSGMTGAPAGRRKRTPVSLITSNTRLSRCQRT